MDSGRWRDVERVLDLALDTGPERWGAVLDAECGADPQLRREVESLLSRYASAQRFLDSRPNAIAAALVADARRTAYVQRLERVGVYRLVREIGHGGTSLVFLAERDDGQFSQQVALKVLRPGRDSEIDHGRFRAERQILASLNHPNIARLLDGGVTEDGLPYLVMEYVDGVPIDRYCRAGALATSQRLQMFVTVAEATQYAHRSLVIHRDLKPSNILVTADGQVKLLDFGLAKLLAPNGHATVPLTTQRWMTPEYAAPEQVRGDPATTLTDVYQLGAVLYELLSEKLPFGTRERSAYELNRAILEDEPVPPSSAASRSELRGDLDAITGKALRKEPEQRYASAQDLADDVRRHLSGRPVLARKQTALYRARRFILRNRVAVAAAAALVVLLGAYASTVTVNARRARATLARVEQEKSKAEGSTRFLVGLFSQAVPGLGPRDTITAQQLLERGERQAAALRDQPLAHAQMLSVLGTIHRNMRSFDKSEALLTEALRLRRASLGEEHVDVADNLYQLGMLARSRAHNDTARRLLRQALAIQTRLLGDEHPVTLETAMRLAHLGSLEEVVAHDRRSLAISRRVNGPEHLATAEAMLRLGMSLRTRGHLAEAERELRGSLEMLERLTPSDHEAIARHLQHLASLMTAVGRLDEAEQLHRRQLMLQERLFGTSDTRLAGALRSLADVLMLKGEPDEAEQLIRRDVANHQRALGEDHIDYAWSLAELAWIAERRGRLAEAESLRRRELAIARRTYGAENANTAGTLYHLGLVLIQEGKHDEAERALADASTFRARVAGADAPITVGILPAIAQLARARGQFARADSLLHHALAVYRRAGYPDEQQDVQRVHRELAALYDARGNADSARAHRRLVLQANY